MAAGLFEIPGLFCCSKIPWVAAPAPDVAKPLGRFWLPTLFAARYLAVAWRVLRRHRPDVLYLNNLPQQHLPALLVARRMGLPIMGHLRAVRPLHPLDRVGTPHMRRFIAVSRRAAAHFAEEGIPEEKLRVVYNNLPLAEFDRRMGAALDAPLAAGPVYVVQVALLSALKQPLLAIEALHAAKPSCPRLQLVLVGDGPLRADALRRAAQLGLERDVHLLGQRSDVPAILARCHIGMLLSKHEGFGNVVLEYEAARLPTVVSNIPSIDEMAVRDETAFVLDQPSAATVADALARLYHDAALRQRMGAAGRRLVEQSPSVTQDAADAVAEQIEEVLSQ